MDSLKSTHRVGCCEEYKTKKRSIYTYLRQMLILSKLLFMQYTMIWALKFHNQSKTAQKGTYAQIN